MFLILSDLTDHWPSTHRRGIKENATLQKTKFLQRGLYYFLYNGCFTNLWTLKGLSYEIDLKNVDENGQILALLRAAAGF
jgi:hypothetical protein